MNALRATRLATFVWACALVAGLAPSASAEIVYTMTNASDLQNGWALSGTITVSGTGTNLDYTAINSWAWTVTKGADSFTYSSNDSGAITNLNGLLATPTALIVPYAPPNSYFGNYLELLTSGGSTRLAWSTGDSENRAYYTALDVTPVGPAGSIFWNDQQSSPNFFPSTTTDGWVIGSVAGSPSSVPEIDPNSLGSVLALVLGSLGILERRRLKAA
jgi:hypothetical protein